MTTSSASEATKVVRALRAAHLHDEGRQALLQMTCERIRAWGPPYTSVYAYMLHDNELVLEAHAGRDTDHTRIPVGKGVCGTAARDRKSIVVPDVNAFPGHIACDSASRSEIVVPLVRFGKVIGVLDLDSPNLARFDDEDWRGLEALAEVLLNAADIGD